MGISAKFVNRLTFAESAVESTTFQFVNLKKKNDKPQAVVSHAESCRTILLQTARASVLDLDNGNSCNTRILFDTGSQRSFITENVRKRLRLKSARTEKNFYFCFW